MPIMTLKRYTREFIKAHPSWYFIFGDNLARAGLGGQAGAARGEPNSLGVATKKAPTYVARDFFTDKEYWFNVGEISGDLFRVIEALKAEDVVVWPADGIGTGIADLANRAPETLKFINCVVESLKKIYGEVPPCA